MSMKALPKLDKFYLIFIVAMVVMASLVIFTFRVVFSSLTNSNDVVANITEKELKVDKDKLNKALDSYEGRNIVPLEIR
jgi:hypothetical protein